MTKQLMMRAMVMMVASTMMFQAVTEVYAVARPSKAAIQVGDRPLANVKVVIKRKSPAGHVTEEEDRTNREGGFLLFPGGEDENAPPIDSIDVFHEGKKYTFAGPFPQENTGEPLELDLFNATLVVPASGVSVIGRSYDRYTDPLFKFGLSYGYKFGSMETSVNRDGNKTNGEDIDVGQSELRLDGRLYLKPLGNLGGFGNLGNLGSIGNIGNIGTVGLSNCFLGLQVGFGVSGGNEGLNTDEHPNPKDGQTDTTLKQEYNGSVTPNIGCKVADFNQFGFFNFQAGARVSWWEYTFTTDETVGSRNFEQRTKDDTKVGAAFGLEYNKHFSYGNLGNLGGFGNAVRGGLQVSLWGEYVPGFDFKANTGTTTVFNYTASAEGAWIGTVFGGWAMYF